MINPSPRITARVDSDTQVFFLRPQHCQAFPALIHLFLTPLLKIAKSIMEHEHILQLSRKDVMRLVDALDAPLKKHSRLQ